MKREDLKIQFRAVQYSCHNLALQYRIDPEDTNNQYTQVKSRFFGLIKRVVTKSFNAKVYSVNVQQHTHGNKDGFYTSYSYIVSTSRGTYSISPDGIFASRAFGALEKDSTYHFFTRVWRFRLLGCIRILSRLI